MAKNNRYHIIDTYNICGKPVDCLCDRPTASGSWFICYSEESAEQRVKELHEAGYTEARYELVPAGEAWYDDENWIG